MHDHLARYLGLIATTTATTIALTACGGGDDKAPDSPTVTKGTIAVGLMNDAPACGFSAVNITVTKLRFRQDANTDPNAAGWTELSFSPAKKINLLNPASVLSGATTDLGTIDLPAGLYTQMALVLDPNTSGSANTVQVAGQSATLPLEAAAAVVSGIRMPVDLRVDGNRKLDLLFDFNACDSIQTRGTAYVLKPRPRLVPTVLNGIRGFVDKSALTSNVVITAQQNGTLLATTVPAPGTGEFVLPRLPADNYDVVVQADGRATAVIGAVPVGASGFTSVASAAAPIPLAASAVSRISGQVTYAAPAVAPDDGTWIMASQSISANPAIGSAATTVTNRLQPVDLASGNYALVNLPRASVQFALYKPALPLALAPAATSAGNGRYRIETVATGFINKTSASANINASSQDVAGVNITLP
jgi:hypothetical protein